MTAGKPECGLGNCYLSPRCLRATRGRPAMDSDASKLKLIVVESRWRPARNTPLTGAGAELVNFPPRRRAESSRLLRMRRRRNNNMAAAGSLASSGVGTTARAKRVMRDRFKRRRMTIYYRWVANGSRASGGYAGQAPARPAAAVYDNRRRRRRRDFVTRGAVRPS